MANSSYDWLFAKPALRWLFYDYIDNNAHAILRLSPGEDPRVSITARFHSSLRANKGRNVVVAEQNSGTRSCNAYQVCMQRLLHAQVHVYCLQFASAGSMTLRYQNDPHEPLTFMDVKVGKQVRDHFASTKTFPGFCMGHALPADCEKGVAYFRAMLHKLELATLMWPTSGVHLAAFL